MSICKLIIVLSVVIVSGCVSFEGYPERSGDINAELEQLDLYYDPNVIAIYNDLGPEAKRRQWRDAVVFGRIRAIDLHFYIFQKTLNMEKASLNIGTDLTVIGLNTAGSLVPNIGTKTVLSTVSSGIIGAKGSIDRNLYYEKTIPVLFSKMESLRKERLVTIQNGLGLDTTKYSLNQGLIDVDDYYKAGTIPGAIMGIAETSGAKIAEASKELKGILKGKYERDEAGDLLRVMCRASDEKKSQLEKWIQSDSWMKNWMEDHDVDKVSVTFFNTNKEFSEARKRAAKHFKLGNFK